MKSDRTHSHLDSKERLFMTHFELETLLTNIPELIYMKDTNGNFVTGTKYSFEFFYKGIDVLSNLQLKLEDISKNFQEDHCILKNNKAAIKEKDLIDINGIAHSYKIYKAPITDIRKEPIGIIVIIKNIDRVKILEAQRNTFVASLGHDLKNPTLAQIRALELLLKGHFGYIADEQREILEMILDSCRYMSGMLSSLLETYRTQKGEVKLNYQKFQMRDLTEECISEMQYVAKDKGVNIILNINCENSSVESDKVMIKRVIMNLLSNGIKYAFKNTNMNIFVYNTKDFIGFKFENESPYISPKKQEEIFSRYVSFAEAHKEIGIGLGLYSSQKIIEAHNGKIFVKSYKNNKNIFGFEIPAKVNNFEKKRTVTF